MGFHVTHRSGTEEGDPPWSSFPDLLAEVRRRENDDERAGVSLTHASGWRLSVFPSGLVVWENVRHGEPRQLPGLPDDRLFALWRLLAEGRIEAIEREPWLPATC